VSADMGVPPFPVSRPRSVRVTKEMLGIQTRKSILYLDHNFLSSIHRGNDPQWQTAMQRITELLDLQLVAVPYSSTHEAEADFYTQRDDLVQFIQRVARGHHFEAYYRVEQTQILKAFQAYLANAAATYIKEERDALPPSVHDWDGDHSVSVFRAASGVDCKRQFKQRAIEELVNTLSNWVASKNTFEQDMELELRDAGRILIEDYAKKTGRLWAGDLSAIVDSPISASVVEAMIYVLSVKKMERDAARIIPAFFQSKHFAQVPSQQLSARLFSTFKTACVKARTPSPTRRGRSYRGFCSTFSTPLHTCHTAMLSLLTGLWPTC
jgi:hypothetical protein